MKGEMATKKTAVAEPTTMNELKATLWKAADRLRGSLSAESRIKDVILGLVFLEIRLGRLRRRAVDAFALSMRPRESTRRTLLSFCSHPTPTSVRASSVFPVAARWAFLAENAKGQTPSGAEAGRSIGALIDEAMDQL